MNAPLAVMAALEQEIGDLVARLHDTTTTHIAKRAYVHGFLTPASDAERQALIVCVARVGKVAAASTATTLIQHFGARAIVFIGLAGGLDAAQAVRVGDMVVATAVAQHDLDSSPLFPKNQIPLLGVTQLATDTALSARLVSAARDSTAGTAARVHEGLIISGDQFIHSAIARTALQDAWPAALGVEMEGAAVGQVCFEHGVPFAIARTISDRADDQAHVDFPSFLTQVAAPRATALLKAFFR